MEDQILGIRLKENPEEADLLSLRVNSRTALQTPPPTLKLRLTSLSAEALA